MNGFLITERRVAAGLTIRLHAGRTGLAESVAFILLGVVTGYRSQDWLFRLPPEDRNGELLVRQGLIQRDSHDVYWEPSPDVIDSLFLQLMNRLS